MEPQQPPAVPESPQQVSTPEPVTPIMAQPAPIMSSTQVEPEKHSDGLGIASLITSIIGLHLVGFILGLIGSKKAKQAGRKSLLSTIGWIWGLIGMILGLAVAGYLVYSYLNLSSVNKKFLSAALDKDYGVACKLWASDSNETDTADCKKFIDGFAKDYKSFKVTSTSKVNEAIRTKVTYTKKDDSTNTGYVDVEKGTVTNFVFGVGASTSVPPVETNAEAVAPATKTSTCLVQSDFDSWYSKGTGLGKTATSYNFNFQNPVTAFTGNVHFGPDSTSYVDQYQSGYVEDWANLAKSVSGKTYTMRLYGSIGTASSDKTIAQQRAEKVKADLMSLGVPASNITIDQTQNLNSSGGTEGDSVSQGSSRVVVMTFDPTCTSGNK